MRIAYVITRADAVGGASIHVRDLAGAMRERGHEVLVLTGGRGPVTELFDAAGLPFTPLEFLRRPVHPWWDARAVGELARVLRAWRPDLVSTHTAKAGWVGRAACARLGVPAVYTPHGLAVGGRMGAAAGFYFTMAERAASRWTSALVCVSESEKRLALARRVAPPRLLHVVYNGVRDVAPELRAVPGSSGARLVSVARLEPPKDHATLLAALAGLRSLDWELELVGDGPLEAPLRRQAASLGLAARVRFLGYQTDIAPALARAHVFVLASRSESFPRSVLEAMRAGLPVVASDVGGIGEAVTHDGIGLLVAPRDPAMLAHSLGGLISAATLRARMGAAARATYEARFRLDTMVEATAAIYARVLLK
jgi:glycosyltransferase involved in cell wall biosynthesis